MALLNPRAFYNGTSLCAPIEPASAPKFMAKIVQSGAEQIVGFLRTGHTIEQIKSILKGQLDLIEAGLCRTQKPEDIWTCGSQEEWVEQAIKDTEFESGGADVAVILWFMNIASLLKMKVIENDDKNGWLMVY